MNQKKYYYVQGFCKAWHLNQLNPVEYTLTANGNYQKKCMSCEAIIKEICLYGKKCDDFNNCPVFDSAPEFIDASNHLLTTNKIG